MNTVATGYTYGTAAVAQSPLSMEDLELLKQNILFTEKIEISAVGRRSVRRPNCCGIRCLVRLCCCQLASSLLLQQCRAAKLRLLECCSQTLRSMDF